MRSTALLKHVSLLVALLLMVVPLAAPVATAFHEDPCDTGANDTCEGSWKMPPVVNPAWWETSDLYEHDRIDEVSNQPAWIYLETVDAVEDPFVVRFIVEGSVVGSVDVYKAQRDFGGGFTADRITPKCPQGFVEDYLLPQGPEPPASPSHIDHVRRLSLEYHRTVVPVSVEGSTPELTRTITFDLPRQEEWVVVFDARAGTNALDGTVRDAQLTYNISVTDGEFDPKALSPPDLPVDLQTWSGNANKCLPV